mmetsp:Transcript_4784/g.8693  ORF Transcript_4784/g.8693 Transcript_4784/m.8693 type:complete len:468 (-) Transcript_4784:469-1872(-)
MRKAVQSSVPSTLIHVNGGVDYCGSDESSNDSYNSNNSNNSNVNSKENMTTTTFNNNKMMNKNAIAPANFDSANTTVNCLAAAAAAAAAAASPVASPMATLLFPTGTAMYGMPFSNVGVSAPSPSSFMNIGIDTLGKLSCFPLTNVSNNVFHPSVIYHQNQMTSQSPNPVQSFLLNSIQNHLTNAWVGPTSSCSSHAPLVLDPHFTFSGFNYANALSGSQMASVAAPSLQSSQAVWNPNPQALPTSHFSLTLPPREIGCNVQTYPQKKEPHLLNTPITSGLSNEKDVLANPSNYMSNGNFNNSNSNCYYGNSKAPMNPHLGGGNEREKEKGKEIKGKEGRGGRGGRGGGGRGKGGRGIPKSMSVATTVETPTTTTTMLSCRHSPPPPLLSPVDEASASTSFSSPPPPSPACPPPKGMKPLDAHLGNTCPSISSILRAGVIDPKYDPKYDPNQSVATNPNHPGQGRPS